VTGGRLGRAVLGALVVATALGACGSHRSADDFAAAERATLASLQGVGAVDGPGGEGRRAPDRGPSAAEAARTAFPVVTGPPPNDGSAGSPPSAAPLPATSSGERAPTAAPSRTPVADAGATARAEVVPGGGPPSNPAVPARARAEIVLGSFGTSSGPIGANVATIPVAVKAWVATVNAGGGLDGHPVRVVFGDDGGDPGRAVALARRMVEQDGAVAFVGTHGPTTLQAVVPYAESRRIPIVGGTTSLAVEDQSPMVFNPQVGLLGAGRGFVSTVLSQTPARTASVVYCREAPGCAASRDVIAAFAPEAGLRIVHEAQVSLAQPDFTAEVVAGRQAGAEAVIAVVDVASMLRYIRAAQRQGWKPVFSGSFAFDTQDAERAGADAEGLLAFSGTANFRGSERMAKYRAAVARFVPGGALGGPGAHAWAQGQLLRAAGRSLPDEVTSAQILAGLLGLRGETLGGIVPPLTFSDGPHRDVNRCIVPIRLTGGRWTQPLGHEFVCS
jgi:branched-chain amino acid transport system substrate-binding protein